MTQTEPARSDFATACALLTSRVHRPGAEAERGGVGALDQLVHVLEGDRGDDGTEDLLLRDAHVVLHAREHGRRDEEALRQRAFGGTATAGERLRAFLLADVEITGDALELLLGNERADLCIGIETVADLQLLAELGDAADELLVDRLLDEQTRAGAADLAGIGEYRHRGTRHGGIEIGVREHDVRRLAAELERDALEIARGGPDDRLASHVRTGEGDLVDVMMRGKRCARGLAVAGHDVDDAGRNAGFPIASSAMRSEVSGASSAGLSTTVQPVAIAGPIFQIVAVSGPFQGMMAPTTPIGSFSV